jgi:hypothetical protein
MKKYLVMKEVEYMPAAKHSIYSKNDQLQSQHNSLKKPVSTEKNDVITVFTITKFITLTVVSLPSKLKFPVCSL